MQHECCKMMQNYGGSPPAKLLVLREVQSRGRNSRVLLLKSTIPRGRSTSQAARVHPVVSEGAFCYHIRRRVFQVESFRLGVGGH